MLGREVALPGQVRGRGRVRFLQRSMLGSEAGFFLEKKSPPEQVLLVEKCRTPGSSVATFYHKTPSLGDTFIVKKSSTLHDSMEYSLRTKKEVTTQYLTSFLFTQTQYYNHQRANMICECSSPPKCTIPAQYLDVLHKSLALFIPVMRCPSLRNITALLLSAPPDPSPSFAPSPSYAAHPKMGRRPREVELGR
ncbi:hypothetical protein EVAR_99351_1 [Eumeta japonica]|uniref:Uncharacterized protein n=1 Tax=Eumeta variegata TaxID=151549 RepID=A0A4C1SMB6_EUMVA|nr:hypothetical protein EVAR_99351_1 [Eumeta japonica]